MTIAPLIDMQVGANAPTPPTLVSASNLLLAPERTLERLRHLPEEVYDLTAESHLVRFARVLLGDAGAGRVRKTYMLRRLQGDLRGARFYDLDRFYGAIFNITRTGVEQHNIPDPYIDTGTSEDWEDVSSADASYRSRIEQFAKAIAWGGTPLGLELAAEAILGCDCDILESYIFTDLGTPNTYGDLEALGTYGDLEAVGTYGQLQGIPVIGGDLTGNRQSFVVRPKRPITEAEKFQVRKALSRLKPAFALMKVNHDGFDIHHPIVPNAIYADSEYWEIVNRSANATGGLPVEQPRPAFSAYQGEAWSYNGEAVTAKSFTVDVNGTVNVMPPTTYVTHDGTDLHLGPGKALTEVSELLAGRQASDGVVSSSPYFTSRLSAGAQPVRGFDDLDVNGVPITSSSVYVDRTKIDDLLASYNLDQYRAIFASPRHADEYWLTPERYRGTADKERLEVTFVRPVRTRYLSFDIAHFPQNARVYAKDMLSNAWVELPGTTITDSIPAIVPRTPVNPSEHPYHRDASHWVRLHVNIDVPMTITGLRIDLDRNISGVPPVDQNNNELAYSLAIRDLEVGYRVNQFGDIERPAVMTDNEWQIDNSLDVYGNPVEHVVRVNRARDLVDGSGIWKCEPQPVRDAVVNLYVDVREKQPEFENDIDTAIDTFAGLYDSDAIVTSDNDIDNETFVITFDSGDLTLNDDSELTHTGTVDIAFGIELATTVDTADVIVVVESSAGYHFEQTFTGMVDGWTTSINPDDFDGTIGDVITFSVTVTTTAGTPSDHTVQLVNIGVAITATEVTGFTENPTEEAVVIDRFFIDPITMGVQARLYWSDDDPWGLPFAASDDPVPLGVASFNGAMTATTRGMHFSRDAWSSFMVDNQAVLLDFEHDWWMGLVIQPDFGSAETGPFTIFVFGDYELRFDITDGNGQFVLYHRSTDVNVCAVDAYFAATQRLKLVVGYNATANEDTPRGWYLVYQRVGEQGVGNTLMHEPIWPMVSDVPTEVRWARAYGLAVSYGDEFDHVRLPFSEPWAYRLAWGAHPDGTGVGGYLLRGMVLKAERAAPSTYGNFMYNPEPYFVKRPGDRSTDNALLRFHWSFILPEWPTGLVGGPGDMYAYLNWHPVPRDYELQKGFIHVPQVHAKFWKFEFTGLTPEPYESFVPIQRTVKLHPQEAKKQQQARSRTINKVKGVMSNINNAPDKPYMYADSPRVPNVVESTTTQPRFSVTDGYYAPAPAVQGALRDQSWVFSMTPWQRTGNAPQQQVTSVHEYEHVEIVHTTKVGFFVGITRLQPYRIDYTATDDTPVIYERYFDMEHLDLESADHDGALIGGWHIGAGGLTYPPEGI